MSKLRILPKVRIIVNLALTALLIWFLAAHEQKIRASVAADRDSTAYWAAGKLLLHRQNPYSAPSVLALQLASLVISIRISWRMYGDGPRPSNLFLLASYLFAPVVACLVAAQMGIVLMLGIALFLLLEEDRPFLAGATLLLPLAKPHIFGLVWPILAVWITTRKRWTLLGGIATSFLAANSIALAFDP